MGWVVGSAAAPFRAFGAIEQRRRGWGRDAAAVRRARGHGRQWRHPFSEGRGRCRTAGRRGCGYPLWKLIDKLVASDQAFFRGVPGGGSTRSPEGFPAAELGSRHRPSPPAARRTAAAARPLPPAPLLNGAEGARRRRTRPSRTAPAHGHAVRLMTRQGRPAPRATTAQAPRTATAARHPARRQPKHPHTTTTARPPARQQPKHPARRQPHGTRTATALTPPRDNRTAPRTTTTARRPASGPSRRAAGLALCPH